MQNVFYKELKPLYPNCLLILMFAPSSTEGKSIHIPGK